MKVLAWIALAATVVRPGSTVRAQDEWSFDEEPGAGETTFREEEAAPPDEMTFQEAAPGEGVMDLGGEPPAAAAVPEVAVPPPAAEAFRAPRLIDVRVTARRVIAGRTRVVPIEIATPSSVRSLRGSASVGTVEDVERREPGVFDAKIRLGRLESRLVIVAVFEGDGCAGVVRIPVWTETELGVDAEPGTRVTVTVAGEEFGPVAAGARGATVPVEIPPGPQSARATLRAAGGTTTERDVDLPDSEFPRAAVLAPSEVIVADDGLVLPVLVAVTDGEGGALGSFDVAVETGKLGDPLDLAPGLRLYSWRPSRALGTFDFVVTAGGRETRRSVEMTAGPPAGIEIMAEPDILPADGRATAIVHAGVTDGLGHFLDAGPIDMMIEGGRILDPPNQIGSAVLATIGAERMASEGIPPAAILVTARGAGHEATVAIRQYDPASRNIRVTTEASRLVADGESETVVVIETLDGFGAPLPIAGSVTLSAVGGHVPSEARIEHGIARVRFRAGTEARTASIRVEYDGMLEYATVVLEPGPPDRIRVEVAEDPDGGEWRRLVLARLEDRHGNGVPPVTSDGRPIAFRGAASDGSLGPFAAAEEGRGVGWMTAVLDLPVGYAGAARVEVAAYEWRESVIVQKGESAVVYLGATFGYAHNFGEVGLIPVRAGFGWNGAFFVPGLLVGLEIGYQQFDFSAMDVSRRMVSTRGWVIPIYGTAGYRLALPADFSLWGLVGFGAEIGWFEVGGLEDEPDASEGPSAAFAVGLRVGAGFSLGPGDLVLDITYDDARYDGLVAGNVGGLGVALGYRLLL